MSVGFLGTRQPLVAGMMLAGALSVALNAIVVPGHGEQCQPDIEASIERVLWIPRGVLAFCIIFTVGGLQCCGV